ncbi:MAG: HlyD family efflux transporter periplasmic adaptor subunit [Nitrospirota bacterium]|nr:HlyD family efflux transporter periplasmic adaptor subunit [Nitrospirota bacterium]
MKITKLNLTIYVIAGLSVAMILSDIFLSELIPEVNKTQENPTIHNTTSPYAAVAKGKVDVENGVIKLAASRDGIIKKILVNEGAYVKQGQALAIQDIEEATLNHRVAQAELNEIKASLLQLKVQQAASHREHERIIPLVDSKALARRELDQSNDQIQLLDAEMITRRAAIKTAEAKLKVSKYEIELRTIRAPADGYVARRLARPGEGASTLSVTPLFWFIPAGPRIIRAEVDEAFIDKIKVGMSADILTVVDETVQYKATVLRIGNVLGPKQPTVYDPRERADIRVVECILKLEEVDAASLILGQRVIVKIKNHSAQQSAIPPEEDLNISSQERRRNALF